MGIKHIAGSAKEYCRQCKGIFPINATYHAWISDGVLMVGEGDRVLCNCADNFVVASSDILGYDDLGASNSRLKTASTNNLRTVSSDSSSKPLPLPLPCLLYKTKRPMDDYDAPDMQHGDWTDDELKQKREELRNKYWFTDMRTFLSFSSEEENAYEDSDTEAAAKRLFVLFKELSKKYALLGSDEIRSNMDKLVAGVDALPNVIPGLNKSQVKEIHQLYVDHGWSTAQLIGKLIDYMQKNTGEKFTDPILDRAMEDRMWNSPTSKKTTLSAIQSVLKDNIDKKHKIYPLDKEGKFKEAISDTQLPKFTSWVDDFNGMTIAVHDTWATEIWLETLDIDEHRFEAVVRFHIQDHFGLDVSDLDKHGYGLISQIFRVWFALQRAQRFNYKPFITEANVRIVVEGTL